MATLASLALPDPTACRAEMGEMVSKETLGLQVLGESLPSAEGQGPVSRRPTCPGLWAGSPGGWDGGARWELGVAWGT